MFFLMYQINNIIIYQLEEKSTMFLALGFGQKEEEEENEEVEYGEYSVEEYMDDQQV